MKIIGLMLALVKWMLRPLARLARMLAPASRSTFISAPWLRTCARRSAGVRGALTALLLAVLSATVWAPALAQFAPGGTSVQAQAWLRADAGTYSDTALTTPDTTDGDQIKGWKDQIGSNNFTLVSVGTATGPTYKAAIQNGLPVLRFNGTSNALLNSTLGTLFRSSQAFTIVMAVKQFTAAGEAMSWNTASQNTDYGYLQLRNTGTTPNSQVIHRVNTDGGAADQNDISTTWAVITVVYDGTTCTIRTDANNGTSYTSGSNVSTINQVVLGAIVRPSNANGVLFAQIDVGDIVFYNSALSSSDLNLVSNVEADKYGIVPATAPTLSAPASFWDGVNLTWTSTALTGHYLVQRSPVSAGTWTTIATVPVGKTTYFDNGFSGSFDYRVGSAVGTVGNYPAAQTGSTAGNTVGVIAPCVRWGKADSLGLANGASVSTYTDSSGSGHDFVQTGTNRPVYTTNVQNGLAGLLFTNSSSQYMTCDAIGTLLSGSNVPHSIAMVIKHTSLTGAVGVQCLWMLADSLSNTQTNDFLFEPTQNAWSTANRNDDASYENILGFGDVDTSAHVVVFAFDGTNLNLYVDGTLSRSQNFAAGQLTADLFTYGAHRRNTAGTPTLDSFLQGYIFEDAVYSVGLSSAEAAHVSSLLQSKWNTPTSAPFAPSQVPGIVAHFRDDSITGNTTFTNGQAVPTWYNRVQGGKFGSGSAFFDLAAVGSPTYAQASLNGRDTIGFPGGANYFSSTNDLLPPYFTGTSVPFAVYGVFKATGVASNQELWSLGKSSGVGSHSMRLTSTPAYLLQQENDATTATNFTGGTPTTAAHAFIYNVSGSTGTLYVDGVQVSTGSLSGGATTVDKLLVGALYGGSVTNEFVGNYGEFAMWTQTISSADRTKLFLYAHNRWGTIAGGTLFRRRPGTGRTGSRGIGSLILHDVRRAA